MACLVAKFAAIVLAANLVAGHRTLLAVNDASAIKAVGTAQNATNAARDLLNQSNANGDQPLPIQGVLTDYLIGHIAAHGSEDAIDDDQITAGIAAAAAVNAVGYASVAVINSTLVSQDDALASIQKAETLTSQVQDDSTVDPTTKASAVLATQAVHDSSLVLYWYNKTGGQPGNYSIFNQSVIFAIGLLEPGANETVDQLLQNQLNAGANPGIGMAFIDVFIHQLHGAVATVKGNAAATVEAQYEATEAGDLAVSTFQNGKTATLSADLISKFSQLVQQAQSTAATTDASQIDALYDSAEALDDQLDDAMEALK